jgi:hypothetical protein
MLLTFYIIIFCGYLIELNLIDRLSIRDAWKVPCNPQTHVRRLVTEASLSYSELLSWLNIKTGKPIITRSELTRMFPLVLMWNVITIFSTPSLNGFLLDKETDWT